MSLPNNPKILILPESHQLDHQSREHQWNIYIKSLGTKRLGNYQMTRNNIVSLYQWWDGYFRGSCSTHTKYVTPIS